MSRNKWKLPKFAGPIACAALFAMGVSGSAVAAPCAGFTDVEDTDTFCKYVEWIRNRSVTLGCTSSTAYCPDESVSRLQMSAFLNRLGTALTPVQLRVDLAPGPIDIDSSPVVCQTAEFAVEDFPRRAIVDLAFAGQATADVSLAADIVQTVDGGANWTLLNANASMGSVAGNAWGSISDLGNADLEVGQSVRWGVRVSRNGAPGSTDLAGSRCQLRVLVQSRTGIASPL